MVKSWRNAVNIAQSFIGEILFDGATAIDATVGNGGDTVFLADAVGPTGFVYGFDIQEKAITYTVNKLKQNNLYERVNLFHTGHERIGSLSIASVNAVMFNLGYLPGGDHCIITRAETTLMALKQSLEILLPGGRQSIIVYTGHNGAEEECSAILEYVSKLESKFFNVVKLSFYNRKTPAPFLILIEKEGFQL